MADLIENGHVDMDIVSASEVVAKVPKETLKALLYMVAGKPDSYIKLFRDPLCIQSSDIVELNSLIQQKLQNHDVQAAITTVNISYFKGEIEQYGVWAEFVEHQWNTHKETESITVKWDFLVKLPLYVLPQRHTVVLKITSKLNPLHLLQAMFSGDPDELENLESESAPVVCRIDFINHVLSDELMRIVENWHKSRIQPLFNPTFAKTLSKYDTTIARIIHYSFPFFSTILMAGILNKVLAVNYLGASVITIDVMKVFMLWLLGSGAVVAFMAQLGKWVATQSYESIEGYGNHAVFDFTNGDKNRQRRLEQQNKESMTKFLLSFIGAVVVNIISSVITIYLFR